MRLELKKTTKADLSTLFDFQTDEISNIMAAFTPENPNDRIAYMEKWTKIIVNPEIDMQTIFVEKELVGSVLHFTMMGETNVSYWMGRKYWGNGIATQALKLFLEKVTIRPLFARVAFDNYGSQRVLEKCGFVSIGTERGFANARKKEIVEFVFQLKG